MVHGGPTPPLTREVAPAILGLINATIHILFILQLREYLSPLEIKAF